MGLRTTSRRVVDLKIDATHSGTPWVGILAPEVVFVAALQSLVPGRSLHELHHPLFGSEDLR